MHRILAWAFLPGLLCMLPAPAQETRSMIFGRVLDRQSSAVAGAQLYYRQIAEAAAAGNNALADQLRHSQKQLSDRYNHYNGTVGGPVVIPKVYNGRDKLFFFVSYTDIRRVIPPNRSTIIR